MSEKTPRDRLRESLRRNAQNHEALPSWAQSAISTTNIFAVPPPGPDKSVECRAPSKTGSEIDR